MPDPFCIQPWDPFGLATIRAWIACAVAHGVPREKVQRAEESFHAIQRWQKIHGTKRPD
jgi:pyrroloquinoline quinone (PQQ) biosynthesis protein C